MKFQNAIIAFLSFAATSDQLVFVSAETESKAPTESPVPQAPVSQAQTMTPTRALDGYQHMAKACVNGYNIVKYADKSITECANLCNSIDNCLGFEYGVDHGGIYDRYNPRDCQPQSSSNTAGCPGVNFNLDFYKRILLTDSPTESPAPQAPVSQSPTMTPTKLDGYQHMAKACVNGYNIVKYADKSLTECANLCNSIDNCLGFEYGVDHGGIYDRYNPRDCQPQSSSNTAGCPGVDWNLDFYKRTLLTDSPTYLRTVEPTISITTAPTPSPTNVSTDLPTSERTILPTAVPTAKCSEDPNGKYIDKISKESGEPVLKTCDSLKNDPKLNKVCEKKVLYTVDHVPPSVMCKVTCRTCNPCYENPNSKWVLTTSSAKLKPCKWLARKDEKKRKKLCKKNTSMHEGYSGALVSCPKACSIYSGIC